MSNFLNELNFKEGDIWIYTANADEKRPNNSRKLKLTRFTFFRVKLYIKERLTTERVSKINKEIKLYFVSCF